MSTAGRTIVVFVAVVVGFVVGATAGFLVGVWWDPAGANLLVSNSVGTVLGLVGAGAGLLVGMRMTTPRQFD